MKINQIIEASVAQRERERAEKRQREAQTARQLAAQQQQRDSEIEAHRREIRKAMLSQKLKPMSAPAQQSVQQPVYTWGGVAIPQDEPEQPDRGFYLLFAPTDDGNITAYWIKDVDYDYQIHDGSAGLESAKKLRRSTTFSSDTQTAFAKIKFVIRELRKSGAVHVLTAGLRPTYNLLANMLIDYVDAYDDELLGIE